MIRMTREAVNQLAGRKPAASLVAPVAPAPAAADTSALVDVALQLATAAQSMAQAAQAMQARPKQLDAVVRRDKEGRMAGVTITVI
jgi:hypothetical protein